MKTDRLGKIVGVAEEVGYVLVATADGEGMPHVTVAGKVGLGEGGSVSVSEWFCPGTVANLQVNKRISIVVWARDAEIGYQLLGMLERIEDLGFLDGYEPGLEGDGLMPQCEKELLIKVEKIIEFKAGPHSDVEE
jgi:hypothetical protein